MRALLCVLCLLPLPAMGDVVPVTTTVSKVIVYPRDGWVTRVGTITLAPGVHDLWFDLPPSQALSQIKLEIEGVRVGPATMLEGKMEDADLDRYPEIIEARARVEELVSRIQAIEDEAASARIAGHVANQRLRFLGNLGRADTTPSEPDRLRALSAMIAEETRAAKQAALDGEIAARNAERPLARLKAELQDAKYDLLELETQTGMRQPVSVKVEADTETEASVTIGYYTDNAYWNPGYDVYLTRAPNTSLDFHRHAFVSQQTGEAWKDVELTLSTLRPADDSNPFLPYSTLREIADPEPPREMEYDDSNAGSMAEPVVEAPVILGGMRADQGGYAMVYAYPTAVSLDSNGEFLRLPMDALTTGAEIKALAAPMFESTAFLVAEFTNDTGEELLPSDWVTLFVDGDFVGESEHFRGVMTGDSMEMFFGPIYGLLLKRTILNENEGGRGLITKSNERVEAVEISVRNLTGDTWPVRVLDRVPYSRQEDLQITWNADPEPSEVDVDNQRGILGWDMTLAPGEERKVNLTSTMVWPDGKELR